MDVCVKSSDQRYVQEFLVPAGPATLVVDCSWLLPCLFNTWFIVSSWSISYCHFLLLWLQPTLLDTELHQPLQRMSGLSGTHLAPGRIMLSLVFCLPRRLTGRVLCTFLHFPILTVLTDRGRELPQKCTSENSLGLPNLLDVLALPSRVSNRARLAWGGCHTMWLVTL